MKNAKVYCKQMGGHRVPLTVSIDWLSDGSIKPLMYWTPDGTCYQITHVLECTPLAFLKDRGEGLRYRVQSKIIETPEPTSELDHSLCEAYLYFADNRFCEKNIVDNRYEHAGKAYVSVMMDVFFDGDYELTYFRFRGERYQVEKTYEVEPRASFHAGGLGLWHKVMARLVNEENDDDPDPQHPSTRLVALYYEINKWFVSVSK